MSKPAIITTTDVRMTSSGHFEPSYCLSAALRRFSKSQSRTVWRGWLRWKAKLHARFPRVCTVIMQGVDGGDTGTALGAFARRAACPCAAKAGQSSPGFRVSPQDALTSRGFHLRISPSASEKSGSDDVGSGLK